MSNTYTGPKSLRSVQDMKTDEPVTVVGMVTEVIVDNCKPLSGGGDYLCSARIADATCRDVVFNIFSIERDALPRLKIDDVVFIERGFVCKGAAGETSVHGRISASGAIEGLNSPNPLRFAQFRGMNPLARSMEVNAGTYAYVFELRQKLKPHQIRIITAQEAVFQLLNNCVEPEEEGVSYVYQEDLDLE